MSSIMIERELTENTFSALFRYARLIIRIHLRGMVAGSPNVAGGMVH
jgi:hypothetical protein